MIVRSPLKEKKARPNLRKGRSGGNGANGTHNPGLRNGSASRARYGRHMDKKRKKRRLFPRLKPWKVILGVFIIGILGVLYLNHVFSTQKLLREVQQLEHEYNRTRRMHADYRLMYDRMTGPAEIYEKAKELGFINGGPAEKVIEVEKE